jgi:hypothetical protein
VPFMDTELLARAGYNKEKASNNIKIANKVHNFTLNSV